MIWHSLRRHWQPRFQRAWEPPTRRAARFTVVIFTVVITLRVMHLTRSRPAKRVPRTTKESATHIAVAGPHCSKRTRLAVASWGVSEGSIFDFLARQRIFPHPAHFFENRWNLRTALIPLADGTGRPVALLFNAKGQRAQSSQRWLNGRQGPVGIEARHHFFLLFFLCALRELCDSALKGHAGGLARRDCVPNTRTPSVPVPANMTLAPSLSR